MEPITTQVLIRAGLLALTWIVVWVWLGLVVGELTEHEREL